MILSGIKVTIIRSSRKTLSLQLRHGEIIARAPLRMKDEDIYKFIESKHSLIEKHLTDITERQKAVDEAEPFTEKEIEALYEKAKQIIPERV